MQTNEQAAMQWEDKSRKALAGRKTCKYKGIQAGNWLLGRVSAPHLAMVRKEGNRSFTYSSLVKYCET
jgi:hypothetical protein